MTIPPDNVAFNIWSILNLPFFKTKESQKVITVEAVKHQNVLVDDKNLRLYLIYSLKTF